MNDPVIPTKTIDRVKHMPVTEVRPGVWQVKNMNGSVLAAFDSEDKANTYRDTVPVEKLFLNLG